MNTVAVQNQITKPRVSQNIVDPECYRIGEYVNKYKWNGKSVCLQPKGLINRGNYCFMNSILQALVACSPFCHLLFGLARNIPPSDKRVTTPVIDGMCRFMGEFRNVSKNKKQSAVTFKIGTSLEPTWIFKMLGGIKNNLIEGRQEDAEEFLSLLLNGLKDEMLELMKVANNEATIRAKNECGVSEQTPICKIFGGLLKSRIDRQEDTSTENVQPFLTLQLDIRGVKTVKEALEMFVARNEVQGLTSSRTNERVVAWQQILLEELPVVLVLHLKCFNFRYNGCTKIVRALKFPVDLDIDSKLLTTKSSRSRENKYKLLAVVYHDGKDASRGHYFTDAFNVGYGCWLRYDDASVRKVTEQQVMNPQGSQVPYLLFYGRV